MDRTPRRRVEARDIGLGQPDGFGARGPKLAEQAAGRIRDDIARRGWPVGAVLGSEGDLLDRYRVSRAVLREAVRLLEHHSIARMRRGPGGGLVVTEPDLTATVDAMALCLEYRHATARDLLPARDALELASVEIVAQEMDETTAARLERSLLVDAATPLTGIGPAHRVHVEIAALTGNPLLEVFVSVLTALWRRHTQDVAPEPPTPLSDLTAEVTRAHRAIVDAILAGDRSLARHRMSRHLSAMTPWWR
jgi:DNA-binding FadR family transcriptional regulator